jgi:hypothetical protein
VIGLYVLPFPDYFYFTGTWKKRRVNNVFIFFPFSEPAQDGIDWGNDRIDPSA